MKRKMPALVSTAILTVITLFMWIAFSVYRVLTEQPPISVPPEILEPISPTLDKEALATLSQRTYFEETDVPETFVNQGPQVTQQLSVPEATPASTISPSPAPEATGSAELTATPTP